MSRISFGKYRSANRGSPAQGETSAAPKPAPRREWPLVVAALVVAGLSIGTQTALASDVSGRLQLSPYTPPTQEDRSSACYWEAENGFKEVKKDRVDAAREMAVVLVGKGPVKVLDRIERPLSGGSLKHETMVVRVGTTVLLQNDDEVAHELYAQGLSSFAPEAISPRGRRSIRLNETGSWPLRDKLIPHVEGHLHVLSNLIAVADVDSKGHFEFKDINPGTYTLKVFHRGAELASLRIEIPSKDFTISPIELAASSKSN